MRPEEQLNALRALYAWANRIDVDGVAVEVGTFSGENAILMSSYFKEVFTVDPWLNGYDKDDHASHANMEEVKKVYLMRTADFVNVSHIELPSVEASKQFIDGEVDFVYLDGNHKTDALVEDIDAWRPKIRKGGIMAGHDIYMQSVHDALAKRFTNHPAKLFTDSSWAIII
jgi:predicted O-methyltransferase YrrM